MTIDDVIERVYRRYLEPAYDRPVSSVLTTGVDSSTTTWVVSAFSSIEYGDAIQNGTVLEAGTELVRVVNVTTSQSDPDADITLTVVRAVMGSVADAHAAGDEVVVAPSFPRMDLELAAFDEIENLYPDLWIIKREDYAGRPFDVPDDFGSIIEVAQYDEYGMRYSMHTAFAGTNSSGDDILHNLGDGPAVLVYAAKTPRPTRATQTFAALGLEERRADIIAMGVAIQFVTGQNVSDLRLDYLTEMMEVQVTEGVSPRNLETNLRRARALRLQEERRRLRSQQQTWTAVNPS